jgi:sugar (glycoside-pentoside-hexuronide) transporter
MATPRSITQRLGWSARVRFASADFAFNLYWQSLTLYLLYFYTDVLGLTIATAATIYMIGSIWDGAADLSVGSLIDRCPLLPGGYRRYLIIGAVPLGLSFVLLYLPTGLSGSARIAAVIAAHLLFRSFYALVNIPYSAMTARITRDSADRTSIAGYRMLFGTAAAMLVAGTTQPLSAWLTGSGDAPLGFLLVALLFAATAVAITLYVARTTREHVPARRASMPVADGVSSLRRIGRNRAFVLLMAAMIFAIFANATIDKSVLYLFKYDLGSEAAGQGTLTLMSLAAGLSIPLWMAIGRRIGGRLVWLCSCAVTLVAVAAFALFQPGTVPFMQAILVAEQIGLIGANFAFWSMLPDTIEYGEAHEAGRADATIFGLAALIQKVAIGAAAGLFGLAFDVIGYQANVAQTPATIAGMRWILILIPAAGLVLSAACIAFNPLRHGIHDRIVATLDQAQD